MVAARPARGYSPPVGDTPRRAGGGGARQPPLPVAARKTLQGVTRCPRRHAPATPWPSGTMRGAAPARAAAPRRRLGGGTDRPVGEQPHARPRVAAALPAPGGADTGSATASAARRAARAGARRRARGARRGQRRRAAVGGVARHRRAGRPVGAPCDDAGDYPLPSSRRAPPSPRRGARNSLMALPGPPSRTRGGTRRVYHPLDEAASAGPWQPWVNPPATGPPTGRRQRACGVLPPSPLPTASHSAAEVAEAALAAVAVVTMVSTAMVEGAPAAIRRPSGQEWQWQWRRPRRCRQQWRQRPSCRLWQCNWRCRQLAAAAPMAVAADMTVLAMALAAA